MNQNSTEEAEKFLNDPEINIWIDKYEDIFAEYDSRPFASRALSDDFLKGIRQMISEKPMGAIELKFNVLSGEKNSEAEVIIMNKLNTHFKRISEVLKKEQTQILRKGYMLLGGGSVLIIALFFMSTFFEEGASLNAIHLMLEPVGWFMTWTGLDHVFQHSRKDKSALDYSARMAFAGITFSSLEAIQSLDNAASRPKVAIPVDNNNLRVA